MKRFLPILIAILQLSLCLIGCGVGNYTKVRVATNNLERLVQNQREYFEKFLNYESESSYNEYFCQVADKLPIKQVQTYVESFESYMQSPLRRNIQLSVTDKLKILIEKYIPYEDRVFLLSDDIIGCYENIFQHLDTYAKQLSSICLAQNWSSKFNYKSTDPNFDESDDQYQIKFDFQKEIQKLTAESVQKMVEKNHDTKLAEEERQKYLQENNEANALAKLFPYLLSIEASNFQANCWNNPEVFEDPENTMFSDVTFKFPPVKHSKQEDYQESKKNLEAKLKIFDDCNVQKAEGFIFADLVTSKAFETEFYKQYLQCRQISDKYILEKLKVLQRNIKSLTEMHERELSKLEKKVRGSRIREQRELI